MTRLHTSCNREPEFAGKFYPENKKELLDELKGLFNTAVISGNAKKPKAIISPHAGYIFSGQVAASAFNQIPDSAKFEKVFVLASSHQMRFKGASVYTSGNYKTPLGIVKVDKKLATTLAKNEIFAGTEKAHSFEHSLEVQLPFLQYRLGKNFLLVAIIIGSGEEHDCRLIASALESYFNKKNLFVISTDFSHYPSYDDAARVDKLTADAVISNNPQQMLNTLEANSKLGIKGLATSMCGWASVLSLMYLTENKPFSYKKVQYLNSGDNVLYGGKDRVVGYHAIAVYSQDEGFFLSEKEKETLLGIARRSLNNWYKIEKYTDSGLDISGVLLNKLGAFVSIYKGEELKGCIGQFNSEKALAHVVKEMVVSAVNDRRFESPGKKELNEITIEVSVLSPLRKINSIDEIELGKHGIYIKSGYMSGTFLPQVATKTGWSLEEFLGHCSRDKAGLGWDGWKSADLFIYEAVVFSG